MLQYRVSEPRQCITPYTVLATVLHTATTPSVTELLRCYIFAFLNTFSFVGRICCALMHFYNFIYRNHVTERHSPSKGRLCYLKIEPKSDIVNTKYPEANIFLVMAQKGCPTPYTSLFRQRIITITTARICAKDGVRISTQPLPAQSKC